jgi:hypothetical protein
MVFDFRKLTHRQSTEDLITVTDKNINVINLDLLKVIIKGEKAGARKRGRKCRGHTSFLLI